MRITDEQLAGFLFLTQQVDRGIPSVETRIALDLYDARKRIKELETGLCDVDSILKKAQER